MELTKDLVEKIIKEANIARKSLLIYPDSHPLSLSRIQSFYSFLKTTLKESPITLGLRSDGFQWEEEIIKLDNPAFQEFHSILRNHEILAIQFSNEVEEEDIKKFFKWISESPEKKEKSLRAIMESERLKGISVIFLDLQLAEIKEEEKIKSISEKEKSERDEILKYLFLQQGFQIIDPTIVEKIENLAKSIKDPHEIREIINGIESALIETPDEKASRIYKFLYSMLSSPSIDECALWLKSLSYRNPVIVKRIASNIPKRILIEVIKVLKEKGIEKSELQLFYSLIFRKDRERIEGFLKNSFYVDDCPIFLQEDYENIIKEIMERIALPTPFPELREEAWKEISEERMNENFFKVNLEALEWDLDKEEASLVVERLLDYFVFYIQTAQFGKAKLIISALEEPKKEEWKNTLFKNALESIKNEKIIKLLIEDLKEVWGREKIEEIKSIFQFMGNKAVHLLMNTLMEEEDKYTRRVLIDIISELGGASEVAISYLKSDKWYVVRNMLMIIRNSGNKELTKEVIPCVDHPHHKVKIEAIKTLAHLGYENTDELVLKLIENPDFDLKLQVLNLVTSLRLTSLVPYLNNTLKEIKLKKENVPWIISLIRALGDIGERSSVSVIKKFLKGSIFYPNRTKLLRREVYRSLGGYPFDEIGDLIQKGLKSRDKEIYEFAYRLSRRISS